MKIELKYLLMCHPVGLCDEGFFNPFYEALVIGHLLQKQRATY